MCGDNNGGSGGNSSKELQMMRESLDQQTLQTRQALAQLVMLRDQLITETNARIEAQVCVGEPVCRKCVLFNNRPYPVFQCSGPNSAAAAAKSRTARTLGLVWRFHRERSARPNGGHNWSSAPGTIGKLTHKSIASEFVCVYFCACFVSLNIYSGLRLAFNVTHFVVVACLYVSFVYLNPTCVYTISCVCVRCVSLRVGCRRNSPA